MGWLNRPQRELSADPGDPVADAATARVEHSGGWPNAHTYMSFAPSTGMGFVLLVNGSGPVAESRLVALDRNIWNVLLGQPTRVQEATEQFLVRNGSFVALAVVATQLALLWWSIWVLERRTRRALRVSPGRRWATLLCPLALCGRLCRCVVPARALCNSIAHDSQHGTRFRTPDTHRVGPGDRLGHDPNSSVDAATLHPQRRPAP